MNRNLFVYGSLMSGAGHVMGEKLASNATLVGAGSIAGRLYAVSWYPGVTALSAAELAQELANDQASRASDRVYGEVYALHDVTMALAWLDAYEAAAPANDNADYKRLEQLVQMDDGSTLTAWVYLFQHDVAGLHRVRSGRWLDYLARQDD